MKRSILFLFSVILAAASAFAQLPGTTWAITGPTGLYFFDFIFQNDGVLSANVGGIVQPVATFTINGDTITTIQSDPEDDCQTPGVYTFEIIGDTLHLTLVSDACADRIFLFTMCTWSQAISTSIQDPIGAPVISFVPNPSNGLIQVRSAQPGDLRISIHQLSGTLVHEAHITSSSATLDLGALPPSIYLVRTCTDQGTFTDRIVIE